MQVHDRAADLTSDELCGAMPESFFAQVLRGLRVLRGDLFLSD